MGKLTLNISGEDKKEAASAGDFSLLPTGWYNISIADATPSEFKNGANKGRGGRYDVQLRVSEGDYTNRRLFVQVPLFLKWNNDKKTPTNLINFFTSLVDDDGDHIYAELNEETGEYELPSEFEVPDANELLGHRATARVRIKANTYEGKTEDRNEVGSFRAYDPDADDPSPSRAEAKATEVKGKAKTKAKKQGGLDL